MEPSRQHEHAHDAAGERAAEAERAPDQAGPAELAAAIGNRQFSDLVAGAGILPGGRVHPSIERTIARSRGGWTPLEAGAAARFSDGLGESVADVRVHADETADALSQSVAARAFTTGSDVYFARGEYRPGTSDGDRLLPHERSHVVQQRGAPTSGELTVSEPGEAVEQDADASARELAD